MNNPYYANDELDLKGIKGSLVLIAIGIVLTLISHVLVLIQSIGVIAEFNSLSMIFQTGEDNFIRANHALVVFDTVFIFVFVIAWLWVAYLFFTQKPTLPQTVIKVFVATIVFNVVDTLLLYWLDANDSLAIEEALFILGRNIIFAAICIPYMLKSKRVNYTFVAR